jgi:hypothetical protein
MLCQSANAVRAPAVREAIVSSATPTERLIEQLRNVTPLRNGGYRASCPTELHAHGDRSRGLYVDVGEEGKCIIWCAAGCATAEIVAALGLTVPDLFQQPAEQGSRRDRTRIPARELLALIDVEVLTVGMIAIAMRDSQKIPEEDWERLSTAVARIGRARDHARGG